MTTMNVALAALASMDATDTAETAPVVGYHDPEDGLTIRAEAPSFVEEIPIEEIPGVTVSADGAIRALADEVQAKLAGFSPKPPVYTVGTLVNETGVANFRQSRQDYEALPKIGEACDAVISRVIREQREDHLVQVRDLSMFNTGKLFVPALQDSKSLSERAFEGLCSFATPGGSGYLRNLGQIGSEDDKTIGLALRAQNMNYWLPRAVTVDKVATRRVMKAWLEACKAATLAGNPSPPKPAYEVTRPREVTLRTRLMGESGEREIFSTVGPKYAAHDVDEIAAQIRDCAAIPSDARVQAIYNGYKASFDVIFHSDVQPEKVVAGEFFKTVLRITTADDGSGSIQVSSGVYRNLCLNLIIVDVQNQLASRRRHVGAGIAESVETGIALAYERVHYFADKWSQANVEDVVQRYGVANIEAVMNGLVANKLVNVAGVSDEDMVARLVTAWQKEPGYTKASVVNAISRAAHEAEWTSLDDTTLMEETAGNLLFAKVWNVEMPRKKSAEEILGW